ELDRVFTDEEDYGDRRGCRLGRERSVGTTRHRDDGDASANQLVRQRRQSIHLIVGPAILDRDVLTFYKASFLQALAEPPQTIRQRVRRSGIKKPDHRRPRLLCPCHQRPYGGRPAEQRDERAARHSITSSASNWTELGTSRPIVLAICTLMTSSNLVNCTTGRSTGFAPLRI